MTALKVVQLKAAANSDSVLPAPLVDPAVDLTDFGFMPLDVNKLRDSDFAMQASSDAFRAGVLLWCIAWHQRPAASLPDNDVVLAGLTGYGRLVGEWQKIRDEALMGFVKCSDGRLYHPTIAEKAREAWQAKLTQRWKTECARIKKHNDRHGTDVCRPTFDEWMSLGCPQGQRLPVARDGTATRPVVPEKSADVPSETHSKGQGEGQGQRQGNYVTDGDVTGGPVGAGAPPPSGDGDDPDDDPEGAGIPIDPPPRDDAQGSAVTQAQPPGGETTTARGRRLPADWVLPKQWGDWALAEFPRWTADTVRDQAAQFRDYWVPKSGRDATKLDWLGTWRNWCRKAVRPKHLRPVGAASNDDTTAEALRLLGIDPSEGTAA